MVWVFFEIIDSPNSIQKMNLIPLRNLYFPPAEQQLGHQFQSNPLVGHHYKIFKLSHQPFMQIQLAKGKMIITFWGPVPINYQESSSISSNPGSIHYKVACQTIFSSGIYWSSCGLIPEIVFYDFYQNYIVIFTIIK